jgi:predicted transcriptional regulator
MKVYRTGFRLMYEVLTDLTTSREFRCLISGISRRCGLSQEQTVEKLNKLEQGGLVKQYYEGYHRYFETTPKGIQVFRFCTDFVEGLNNLGFDIDFDPVEKQMLVT